MIKIGGEEEKEQNKGKELRKALPQLMEAFIQSCSPHCYPSFTVIHKESLLVTGYQPWLVTGGMKPLKSDSLG